MNSGRIVHCFLRFHRCSVIRYRKSIFNQTCVDQFLCPDSYLFNVATKKSGVRRTRNPPNLLSPFVSLSNNLPDKGAFRLRVSMAIFDQRILLCQPDFQLSILGGDVWVSPHIIAKKERKLFTETS